MLALTSTLVAALLVARAASAEPSVPQLQLRNWVRANGMGRLRLDNRSSVLEVSDHGTTARIRLDELAPGARTTNFARSGEDAVVVSAYEKAPDLGLLLRVSGLLDDAPRVEVLYRGDVLRRPIALAVGWPTKVGVVVLDHHERALYSFEPASARLTRLVDARTAPSLAVTEHIRVLDHAPGTDGRTGYEIRLCSAHDHVLTVPQISKPSWVFLFDADGDGAIESVQDAPWAGAR
jgi:hypothetical protein